jgi:hypothetical protein
MSHTVPEFGLTPEELQQIVASVMQPWGEAPAIGEEYVTPAEYTARRLAWEAAAALVAANNRRLNEQLRQLGLVSETGPAAFTGPAAPAAPVIDGADREQPSH